MRVLCTGDIHIGRRSSKVSGDFRCSGAWSAIVDLAIAECVDLLAISGDIVDKESKSYESIGPLQQGLARLDQAGIETVAIAGNHDFDVLPRLAEFTGTQRFHLLGRGGQWQRHTFIKDGTPALHIDGWSFPHEHVNAHPLRSWRAGPSDGVPVLGVAHGDVDAPQSTYAPLMLDDLWAATADLWLLGHIHASRQFRSSTGRLAFYPGSPWAMDPGEMGTHGVWLAMFAPGQSPTITLMPISPVRYDTDTVDISSVTNEGDFQRTLAEAMNAIGKRALVEHGSGSLAVVSFRLHLTGRSVIHRTVSGWAEQWRNDLGGLTLDGNGISVEIDTLTNNVQPPIDLDHLAKGNDPVAETAKLIRALDDADPDPASALLIRQVHDDLTRIHQHPGYASIANSESDASLAVTTTEDKPELTYSDARNLLRRHAWDLLSALVAQKELA